MMNIAGIVRFPTRSSLEIDDELNIAESACKCQVSETCHRDASGVGEGMLLRASWFDRNLGGCAAHKIAQNGQLSQTKPTILRVALAIVVGQVSALRRARFVFRKAIGN